MVRANDFQYSRDEKEYVASQIAGHNQDEAAHPYILGMVDELSQGVKDSVKKEAGKVLSSNDFTDGDKENLSNALPRIASAEAKIKTLEDGMSGYVKKESGKGLSTNDYTDRDKEKIDEAAGSVEIFRADMNVYATREQARVTAEKARQENESKRETAENLRAQEEGSRVLHESARVTNENAREGAELERADAEAERVRMERIRVEAEAERRSAEADRVALYPRMVDATDRAEQVADNIDGLLSEKADKEEFDNFKTFSVESFVGLNQGLNNKVDKVEGKGLSTNDYTDNEKAKVDGAWEEFGVVYTRMENKVDKEEGKGLSTNDYTDGDKATVASCILPGTAEGKIVLIDDARAGEVVGVMSSSNPAERWSDVNVYIGGLNLYDNSTKEVNKNFNSSGAIVDVSNLTGYMATGANVSDYIPVVPLSTMTINYCNCWVFYDANKNIIEKNNKSATTKRTVTVPTGAYYMRFSYHTADTGATSSLYNDGAGVMAVLGSTLPSVYRPFTRALALCENRYEHTFTEAITPPYVSIVTDTAGVTVKVEYVKDVGKVIENLTNAIISLGGNV